MEALVAVTAFAGALFAAITTGILVGRLRDERSGWLIAWTVTTASLCLALGAIAIGHLMGFGSVTFRVYQITGAFLAPFWLAIGLIQLLARKPRGRFAAWLFGTAFTVVSTVIMVVDPISQPEKFTKALPLADTHWTIIPTALLTAAHALTYLMLIGCLILAVLRWRNGDDVDADNMHAGVVLAPTGLALVGAVRFAIPGVFAALVVTLMVGAVWYAVARPLAPYDEERDDDDEDWDDEPAPRRAPEPQPAFESGGGRRGRRAEADPGADRSVPEPQAMYDSGPGARGPEAGPGPLGPTPAMPPPPRRSGLGDLVAEYRAGDQGEVDFAARMQPSGGFVGPMTGEFIGPDVAAQGPAGPVGYPTPGQNAAHRAPVPPPQDPSMPATGVLFSAAEIQNQSFGRPDPQVPPPVRADVPVASAGSVKPSSGIYGLLTVFTLIDGAGEAFDRLAEETVEAVRRSEPDTLIFACHSVKSAPLQRIVYEIYRDEVAFTEHQRQAHMERFARERVAHVLAANVIELNVNAAKVVPLPTAFRL
ncbi:putative quinol monooxygenase [Sphaerisporangium fuscum]|uniref:putative quinol monooxygenase n=1 Tax=Sphaerisporangium fuscum TaxID=2835868 RepID=UPI001BDD3C02|nr:antibiotic biosynthesis monooxygenase [Sphaerisporangium fuscum]